jgi:FkbM family methyltransferase
VLQVRLSQSKVGPLVCPQPLTVDVDLVSLGPDVRLRSHTTDISVLGEVVVGGAYGVLAAAATDEPRTIVDLGSNTGLAARWLLERFPRARLVSVEPEEGNLAVLRHNLAPYEDRARVIGAAIGGHERRVALTTTSGEFGFTMSDIDSDDGAGNADVVVMESVLADLPWSIDLLKCDIEGAERELFESCADWLPRVRLASVECHGAFTQKDLVALMRANGVDAEILMSESTPQFGCETVVFRVPPS